MKTRSVWWVVVLALALAAPALAGGGHGKCTADTQACLNYMAAKYKARGWVGLDLDEDDNGVMTVREVVPDSPAVEAGFRSGDRLVALDGLRFAEADRDTLKTAWEGMAPGKQVTYTVLRSGEERDLDVTLGTFPEEVLARVVGSHMMDHVTIAQN